MEVFEAINSALSGVELVVPYIFLFLGGVACFSYLSSHFKIRIGKPYIKTRGKIIHSNLEEVFLNGLGVDGASVSFSSDIKYEYEAGGVKYYSQQIYKDVKSTGSSDKMKIELFLKGFPVGKEIDVYYHPSKPSKSYLIESSELSFGLFIVGLVFISIGLFKI
jgi:hypothetical protein